MYIKQRNYNLFIIEALVSSCHLLEGASFAVPSLFGESRFAYVSQSFYFHDTHNLIGYQILIGCYSRSDSSDTSILLEFQQSDDRNRLNRSVSLPGFILYYILLFYHLVKTVDLKK